MAKIPRVIKWGFDPDKSEVEALRNPQDRILWSVLRSGHIVDQHFNGTMAEFGRYIRQYPPADAQVLAELAHRRFGLHGYGVAPYARMPFDADLEWWGELLEAWRGNIVLQHELPAAVGTSDERNPASFQQRVEPWLMACFGEAISNDITERNHRFLEEALELVQAGGCTASEAHQLVDYVFGRPVGELRQEAGGVMVTLAALCRAQNMNMHEAGEVELARIWTMVEKIRAKQAAKPKHSPLPEHASGAPAPAPTTTKGVRLFTGIGCLHKCEEPDDCDGTCQPRPAAGVPALTTQATHQ